jgi:hypothetical protein
VAFAFVERQRTPANFYFYTTAGVAFVLAGASFLLPASPRALLFAALAVGCAIAARRAGRATLAGHAATYAFAAMASGGVLEHAWEAAFAPPDALWTQATIWTVCVALATGIAAYSVMSSPTAGGTSRIPRVVLLALGAVAATGLLIGWAVPLVAGVPGAGADPGAVATVRTSLLAAGAFALAALGRREGWVEARWLSAPVLALGGVKILIEDLKHGRPATWFLAFAIYGAALILVPRMRRREILKGPASEREAKAS